MSAAEGAAAEAAKRSAGAADAVAAAQSSTNSATTQVCHHQAVGARAQQRAVAAQLAAKTQATAAPRGRIQPPQTNAVGVERGQSAWSSDVTKAHQALLNPA